MSNVKLLPLPLARLVVNHHIGPISETDPFWNRRDMSDYARACVEANTEALRAELREAWSAVDSKAGWEWKKRAEQAEARAERLAEALRHLRNHTSVNSHQIELIDTALHPTAAQENDHA